VLTYHVGIPRSPTDSLYVCLNIPKVKLPDERSLQLSDDLISQVPFRITKAIKAVSTVLVSPEKKLEILDYELELANANAPSCYGGASITEILKFFSLSRCTCSGASRLILMLFWNHFILETMLNLLLYHSLKIFLYLFAFLLLEMYVTNDLFKRLFILNVL
jgi:hypothetical protein